VTSIGFWVGPAGLNETGGRKKKDHRAQALDGLVAFKKCFKKNQISYNLG
jgi:hypothetical protein